jgi:hypothetical protein
MVPDLPTLIVVDDFYKSSMQATRTDLTAPAASRRSPRSAAPRLWSAAPFVGGDDEMQVTIASAGFLAQ